jgi:hypothetical protein
MMDNDRFVATSNSRGSNIRLASFFSFSFLTFKGHEVENLSKSFKFQFYTLILDFQTKKNGPLTTSLHASTMTSIDEEFCSESTLN